MAEADGIPSADIELFIQLVGYYQELLDRVCSILGDLDFTPTSRVKTTGTLVEKLRREKGLQLTRLQDVAGARLVVDGGILSQHEAVALIRERFADEGRKPVVVDRCKTPVQGYRAVHVVVYPDDFPVEIQVRTTLQNIWAQIFERLADQWGRGIRYGSGPDPCGSIENQEFRERTVSELCSLSDSIYTTEVLRGALNAIADLLTRDEAPAQTGWPDGHFAVLPQEEVRRYRHWRATSIGYLNQFEPDRRRRGRIIRRNLPRDRVISNGCAYVYNVLAGPLRSQMLDLEAKLRKDEADLTERLEQISRIPERKGAV